MWSWAALLLQFARSHPLQLEENWFEELLVDIIEMEGVHLSASMPTERAAAQSDAGVVLHQHITHCIRNYGLDACWLKQSFLMEKSIEDDITHQQLNAFLGLSRVELYVLFADIGCLDTNRKVK